MSNDPVLFAYGFTTNKRTKKRHWKRIGAAWPHEAGAGLSLILEYVPAEGGPIVLLEPNARDDAEMLERSRRMTEGKKGTN